MTTETQMIETAGEWRNNSERVITETTSDWRNNSETITYRVRVGAVDHMGIRRWGKTTIVAATDVHEAADRALELCEASEAKANADHNANAERFGTWKIEHSYDWVVEGVRKAPTRRA